MRPLTGAVIVALARLFWACWRFAWALSVDAYAPAMSYDFGPAEVFCSDSCADWTEFCAPMMLLFAFSCAEVMACWAFEIPLPRASLIGPSAFAAWVSFAL